MSVPAVSQTEEIARLNDLARQAMGIASIVVATPGFLALTDFDQSRVRELVETFDAFTPDNDPYGERDFGAIYQSDQGLWSIARPAQVLQTVFWKINACDPDLCFGSENPADPEVTRRVESEASHEFDRQETLTESGLE